MKNLKEKPIRYKNCRIDNVESVTMAGLVQIVKAPKVLAKFIGKKYITLDKAKIAIDYQRAMNAINYTNIKSGELESVVIIDEM